MLLDTSDVVHLDLGGCKTITDQCLIDMVKRSQKPRMAHLESREKVIVCTGMALKGAIRDCGRKREDLVGVELVL